MKIIDTLQNTSKDAAKKIVMESLSLRALAILAEAKKKE